MIGYEFEFLVREGDRPLSKKTFEVFHGVLAQRGWTPVFDPGTKGLVGSQKDGFFVTTDDGVCTMEINTPPRDTINQCHEQISPLISELQSIYRSLGCSIIGTSVFPGYYDIKNKGCMKYCVDTQCCNKSYIKYFSPERFAAGHHALYVLAAHQVWLDVKHTDLIRQWNMFQRLTPVLYALFSNGPVFNNASFGVLEGRDVLWRIMLESSSVDNDEKYFGMTPRPFTTLVEYFEYILGMPFLFGTREGMAYRLINPEITYRDFFFSQESEAELFDGTRFIACPTKNDFLELQQKTFPHVRIKYHLRQDASLQEIISALQNRDEHLFFDCFEKVFLECRAISAQVQSDISSAPAFLLGIQENINDVALFTDKQPYSFWQALYSEVAYKGLDAVVQGLKVVDLAEKLDEISRIGLQKRGFGEEFFLKPIQHRIKKRQNPAQELLAIWQQGGLEAIWKARDYCDTVNVL